MSDFEPTLPAYFVVSRKLDDVQLGFVNHALRLTQTQAVIVTINADIHFARKINDDIIRVSTIAEAHRMAQSIYQETGERVAIIGDTTLLDAYDANGSLQVRQERDEVPSSEGNENS